MSFEFIELQKCAQRPRARSIFIIFLPVCQLGEHFHCTILILEISLLFLSLCLRHDPRIPRDFDPQNLALDTLGPLPTGWEQRKTASGEHVVDFEFF